MSLGFLLCVTLPSLPWQGPNCSYMLPLPGRVRLSCSTEMSVRPEVQQKEGRRGNGAQLSGASRSRMVLSQEMRAFCPSASCLGSEYGGAVGCGTDLQGGKDRRIRGPALIQIRT